ncbi:hypothetical protein VTL71DRAFT_9056 [Oculimacula yallundae]|uniref:DUF6594 domain-containing protein n=1 Tax=Oculimacula yallundae TaxID=86028 RepID=A0ABR4BTM9_9HELO
MKSERASRVMFHDCEESERKVHVASTIPIYGPGLLDQISAEPRRKNSTFVDHTAVVIPTTIEQGSRNVASGEEVKYCSSTLISRLVTTITVIAASIVIDVAVVVLYIVQDEKIKLGLMGLFTRLFAASLAILTDGKRTDIILATAACATVLVVFVSQSQ